MSSCKEIMDLWGSYEIESGKEIEMWTRVDGQGLDRKEIGSMNGNRKDVQEIIWIKEYGVSGICVHGGSRYERFYGSRSTYELKEIS